MTLTTRTKFNEAVGPHVSFSFGRMNPPHYGHEGLIKTLQSVAKNGAWALFLSKSQDAKKNPLTYAEKLAWVKTLYPQTQGHLVEDSSIKTFLEAASHLYDKGFRSATFVAGEDDMASMRPVLEKYNGKEMGHGYYQFEPLTFMESPRLTSATNAREAAKEGNPEKFELATRVPQNIIVDGKTLFQAVRRGMGLGEAVEESIIAESLSVEQLAHISDKALDDAYHYGLSTPGNNFGWLANIESAAAAKRMIDSGITDVDAIASAIHDGWNKTAVADYMGKLQLDTPTIPDKKKKRYALAQQTYAQLPEVEKEKDRVVARAMLQALGVQINEDFTPEQWNELRITDPKAYMGNKDYTNRRWWTLMFKKARAAARESGARRFEFPPGSKNSYMVAPDLANEGKVKLYTDPDYFGAEVDDSGFDALPIINIPTNKLVGFEPDDKMKSKKSQKNVAKIIDGLEKNENIPPILVRKYKGGYQVLDGHHRFWAYKTLKKDSIPARLVPDSDIEEISKNKVNEAAEKSTKATAKYQAMPRNGQRCDHCTMWRPPHGCSAVSGKIAPNGWCSYYKRSHRSDVDESENLDEAASSVLFHYTGSVGAALNILKNNEFKLSISTGTVEAQYAPKGYNYFMSATRSKVGGYHEIVGDTGVMFNLDGNWFNSRYPVKAIDYWAGMHRGDRHNESEDRIFAREPSIPADAITAIHILLKEKGEYGSPTTRQLMITSKKRGLPTYLYSDESAWRLQDIRRALPVSAARDILSGIKKTGYISSSNFGKRMLGPWLELIFKKSRSELSKKANDLRYGLTYWNGGQFSDDLGLRNEISNARKPGNSGYAEANKIIAAMRKIGANDVRDLLMFLHKKWDAEAMQPAKSDNAAQSAIAKIRASAAKKESVGEHAGSIIGTVGGGNDYPDRQVATFPWDRWIQPDTGNSKLDYVDDLDEVNMSPSALSKFATTPQAQAMTIGFEAEMLVPGLKYDDDDDEDYGGVSREQYEYRRDSGNWDLSKDAPFPTDKEWVEKVLAWASESSMLDSEDIGNIRVELLDMKKDFVRSVGKKSVVSAEIVKPENLKWIAKQIYDNNDGGYRAGGFSQKDLRNTIMREPTYEYGLPKLAREIYRKKMIADLTPEKYEKLFKKFLKDAGQIDTISDWFLEWAQPNSSWAFYPFLTGTLPQDSKELTVKELANSWKAVIGAKVKYGGGYHGLQRDATSWILEPDGSISGKDNGIELISPPMPLQQGLTALDTFFGWASEHGYYGNDSTGFHVGVSLPSELQANIDPLKVVMLLGDKYVLDLFDRGSNAYTKSSLDQVKELLKSRRTNVKAEDYAKVLRNNLAKTAQAIVNRMGDNKYVSVHLKSNYIEFRSAGGNFLEHIDDIKNTVLRYVQVMAIAADPQAYREEYAKKLYKLISKNIPQGDDQLTNFAMYASGLIDQNVLKMRLQKRQVDKAKAAADAKTKVYRIWIGDPPHGSNLSEPKRFATPVEAYAWAKSYAKRVNNFYDTKDLYLEPDDHSLPPQLLSKPASGAWLQ